MSILALPLALILPTAFGWFALRLLEGKHPVLFAAERFVMGGVLGLTSLLFVQFLLQTTVKLPFNAASFLAVQGTLTALLAALWYTRRKSLPASPTLEPSPPLPRTFSVIITILLSWSALKAVFVGVVFLILTPTYFQDSLNNWNLRGKVFYETQALTLVMPNEDPNTSKFGVSSYPPTVPLAKALVADMAGEWNEVPVNALHGLWYLSAIALLYFALRRHVTRGWGLLGLYGILSLPLYLMHGTNAYADAFVSVHVFCAVSLLFHASRSEKAGNALSYLRIASIAGALLVFTKNEGMLVFLPPFVVCALLTLWMLRRKGTLSGKQILVSAGMVMLGIACIAGPWLLFKWANGLTFGNAKAVSDLGFGWQENVLFAVIVNTFSEGNWLLLFPLFFALLIWQWRASIGSLLVPVAFFFLVYVGQMMIYLFTSLSHEALMQTGYARGLIQLMPVTVMLTVLLLHAGRDSIRQGLSALAGTVGLRRD